VEPEGLEEPLPAIERVQGLTGLSNKYAIDVGEWFRYATTHWGAVLGPMIGYSLLFVLIVVAGALIPFVGGVLLALVLPPLLAGFSLVPLAQLRGERWTFAHFFGGFRWYWPILANTLLTGLILLVCMLPGQIALIVTAPSQSAGSGHEETSHAVDPFFTGALIFALLNLLVTGYIGLRCALFSLPLILDRNCGPVQALRGSWTLTRGHFWGLLGVVLLLGLINLGGMLLFGIGTLFTWPLTQLVFLEGYLVIAGSRPPVPGPSAGAVR
jgi:hypothetical protein